MSAMYPDEADGTDNKQLDSVVAPTHEERGIDSVGEDDWEGPSEALRPYPITH